MRRLYGKTLKKGFSKSLYSIAASGGGAPAAPYQEWAGYPDSPVLTADYPNQFVNDSGVAATFLMVSTGRYYVLSPNIKSESNATNPGGLYKLVTGNWTFLASISAGQSIDLATALKENNCPIYTDTSYTTVAYPKTTP
jgi:hypothetical protein